MLRRKEITQEKRKKKRGQSTIEYLLLATAVIAVMIVILKPGGLFQNTMNSAYQTALNGALINMATRLANSYN